MSLVGFNDHEKLEALFATMLVKELRRALPNEGFFGGGKLEALNLVGNNFDRASCEALIAANEPEAAVGDAGWATRHELVDDSPTSRSDTRTGTQQGAGEL